MVQKERKRKNDREKIYLKLKKREEKVENNFIRSSIGREIIREIEGTKDWHTIDRIGRKMETKWKGRVDTENIEEKGVDMTGRNITKIK